MQQPGVQTLVDFRIWALLSALFAGMTAVLSKKGLEEVPANLALAVRVTFILVITWAIAIFAKETKVAELTSRQLVLLGLSAVATGASWLCYFRALQGGPVSAVAPIDKLSFVVAIVLGVVILREKISWPTIAGSVLIVAGVLVTLTGKN